MTENLGTKCNTELSLHEYRGPRCLWVNKVRFPLRLWGYFQAEGQDQLSRCGWKRRNWGQFSSVQFSRSVMSKSLRPHGLQHARPPCPPPTPGACSNLCPSSQWCHPTISSSVVPFSSRLQSFPASGFFPVSQFFASGVQNIGASASASVFAMNI